jgi:(p)ppGpp synthase/HD superfamily hydrolase
MGEIRDGIRADRAPQIEAARQLMRFMFDRIVDKGGNPYSEHCDRVEQRLPDWVTEDARCAALLHDIIEDTPVTADDLRADGFSDRTVWLVEKLSRRPEDGTYIEWIKAIAATGDAELIAIKLSDNIDNSDPDRIAALPPEQRDIVRRYERARRILEPALLISGRNLADAHSKSDPRPEPDKEG